MRCPVWCVSGRRVTVDVCPNRDGSPDHDRLYEAWNGTAQAILEASSRTGADILAKLTLAEEWIQHDQASPADAEALIAAAREEIQRLLMPAASAGPSVPMSAAGEPDRRHAIT